MNARPRLSVVRDEGERNVLVLLSPDELGKVCAALAAVNVGGWLSPLLARLNETAAAHRPMHVDSDPTPPRGMPRPGGAVS